MGQQKTYQNVLDRVCVVIATMLGLGYTPLLGGTIGSLCGLLVFLLAGGTHLYAVCAYPTAALSFPVSHRAEIVFAEKDSKKIIIDDFSGMLISFAFLPRTPFYALAGFFLFRAFDFFKVYPANKIERLHGGLGVTGDDVVAGVYTSIVLHVIRYAVNAGS